MKGVILTRRGFLRMACVLVGIVSISTRLPDLFAARDASRRVDLLASKLGGFFHDRASANAVGLEYLRIAPIEANTRKLTELICSSWQERYDDLTYASMGEVKRILLHQQREDFEKGRIVNVQGWILSETEARLCALTALV